MIGNPIVHLLGRAVSDMECGDVSPPGESGDTSPHSRVEPVRDEHEKMRESPVEWAAVAYKMLGFKAPLEVFYATDMRCAKLRICIREIYFNI